MNKVEIENHRRLLIELNKEKEDKINELQLKNEQLKGAIKRRDEFIKYQQERIDKAIEYIKECMETTYKINDYWTNELVNGVELLEILGDKEWIKLNH